jgi:acetoin utilization deacetylase AcuC-like enzyme
MFEHQSELIFYYPVGHENHQVAQHPERPERIETIRSALDASGLWHPYDKVPSSPLDQNVLYQIHSNRYLDRLKQACERGEWFDQDTYLLPASWNVALETAGGATSLVRQVWKREANVGFALCRPPGHHATSKNAMGFCLLNNIALVAEDLLRNYDVKRIAILDFDLHHGNGTQEIFYARGDVFYISTHQWPLYPGTGKLEEQGIGEGFGTTANIPFPPGTGDEGFLTCLEEFILPLLEHYQPEILLLSIGFDPHWMDPLGFLQITAAGYGKLITILKQWAENYCEGRIAAILEGGYNLEAIAACSQSVVSALLGQPYTDMLGKSPHRDTDRWQNVLKQLRNLWRI